MLLQLGGCEQPGGITLTDWIRSDAMCFQQRSGLDQEFRDELLAEDGGTPFTCPEGGRWFLQLRVSARMEYGL